MYYRYALSKMFKSAVFTAESGNSDEIEENGGTDLSFISTNISVAVGTLSTNLLSGYFE